MVWRALTPNEHEVVHLPIRKVCIYELKRPVFNRYYFMVKTGVSRYITETLDEAFSVARYLTKKEIANEQVKCQQEALLLSE